jgi:hypothetical protein
MHGQLNASGGRERGTRRVRGPAEPFALLSTISAVLMASTSCRILLVATTTELGFAFIERERAALSCEPSTDLSPAH